MSNMFMPVIREDGRYADSGSTPCSASVYSCQTNYQEAKRRNLYIFFVVH